MVSRVSGSLASCTLCIIQPATGSSLHAGNTRPSEPWKHPCPEILHWCNRAVRPIPLPVSQAISPASPTVVFYKFSSRHRHMDWGKGAHTADLAWVKCLSSASESVKSHPMCVKSSSTQFPVQKAGPCFSASLLSLHTWQSDFPVPDLSQLQWGNAV